MKKIPGLLYILGILFFAQTSCAQENEQHTPNTTPSTHNSQVAQKKKWVDSIYNSLNQQEKIGQLFMVAAYSGGKNMNNTVIEQLIKNHQIGGVIFMQGTPDAQAKFTNQFQKSAQVPLLIGMDAEWGLGMRLTGVTDYPKQMMMGATKDTALMYQMGKEIGSQCKRLGVHINFAPDVDINNNPNNPIINFRSFGENKELVSKMGIAYMKGMQENGILACAKHFPGHGDVSVDSHQDLPVIKKSKEELEELELYPFQQLINAGVKSVMIAHLSVPALDNTEHLPSTLSRKIVTDLLIKEMEFKGLIFTDALNMNGVTKYFPDGETDLKAFLAGNDVLLFSQNVPLAISKIENAIKTGKASEKDLERSVKKILSAKYDMGLSDFQEIKTENILEDINTATDNFKNKAAQNAVTIVKDENQILEKLKRKDAKVSYISINNSGIDYLKKELEDKYKNLSIATNSAGSDFDAVVVSIHSYATYPGKGATYGLDVNQINLIKSLSNKKNVIFVVLGNAYIMKYLCDAASAIVTYEDNIFTEKAASAVLDGSREAKGTLPVTTCK